MTPFDFGTDCEILNAIGTWNTLQTSNDWFFFFCLGRIVTCCDFGFHCGCVNGTYVLALQSAAPQ